MEIILSILIVFVFIYAFVMETSLAAVSKALKEIAEILSDISQKLKSD